MTIPKRLTSESCGMDLEGNSPTSDPWLSTTDSLSHWDNETTGTECADSTLPSSEEFPPPAPSAAVNRRGWWLIVPLLLAPLAVMALRQDSNGEPLVVAGRRVADLRPGAPVILDGVTIGEVDRVELVGGQPTARLHIPAEDRRRINAQTRVEVASLNRFLPGNMAVKFHTEDGAVAGSVAIADSIRSGRATAEGEGADGNGPGGDLTMDMEALRERLSDPSILPSTSSGAYYLVMFAVAAVVLLAAWVVLRVAIRLIRSAAFWGILVVAAALVAWIAWQNGHLHADSWRSWLSPAGPRGGSAEAMVPANDRVTARDRVTHRP